MKKIITSFMVLFLLIGIETKSYGQASGDYVFVQPVLTDSAWLKLANWGLSDGATGTIAATRLPGTTDNVFIPSGKGVSTSISQPATFTSGSATITLNAPNTTIAVGMAVSGTGIPTGALVSSVSGTSLTLSAATTSTPTAPVRLIFTIPTSTGSVTLSSTSVTLTAANPTVVPGMIITGTGIATGTTVQSVSGTTVTLSQAATATNAASTLTFAVNGNCKNLTVSGAFKNSISFVVNGDVTVNSGALLTMDNEMYCKNITNYGTFNASAGYRSAKSLFVGFNVKVPGNSDYTIINDGTFGDTAPKVPQGTTSGIKVLYSNQANSLTIKTSTPSISAYAFNIAQILPHANIKTTANTNLNIKENMSLLIHNGIGLSIQNTDTCTGTTRTCTIDPGITVYVGYRFHSGGPTSNDQGSFVYNVYGTLDMGTYASPSNNTTGAAANTSDFNLSLSSVAGNTGSLTFNLGDGTQAKAGTLILGSNIKLIKQKTQTIALNFKDYSTVKVTGNYGWVMNYQLLNSNNPALYLFPKNYYNLTLNGAGVILPVIPVVKGTKVYTTGVYGTSNWVTATSPVQGSVIYTGSNYYYVPVVRSTTSYSAGNNPITIAGDTILQYIQPGQTISGGSGITATVSSLTGNSLQMSAAVAVGTTTQTNITISFIGTLGATAPTGTSSNSFSPVFNGTQGLIYLGGYEFGSGLTAVNSPDATSNVFVYSTEKNKLVISNATEGDMADVYTVSGIKVATAKLTGDKTTLNIASGIYLVKVNSSVSKVIVR